MESASELEGVVLGIVHRLQPCTAYAVRREMRDSPSTHWSASAGSIYPLLNRLEAAGLLDSTSDPNDGRGRRLIRLTGAGLKTLRSWTLGASDPGVASRIFDAVRTRSFSVGALTPRQREKFATESLAAVEQALATARSYMADRAANRDDFERLASLGGVYQAEARVRWMREYLAHVNSSQAIDGSTS